MQSSRDVIQYSWNRLTKVGKQSILVFGFVQIIGLMFDGLGLLYISKALTEWSRFNESSDGVKQQQILSEIGIGMACLIARGIITIWGSRHTLRNLEGDEASIAAENYLQFQTIPWEKRSKLPLSSLIELIQESPFYSVSVTFNLVASSINVFNLAIVAILIIYMNPIVALSTLLFFVAIGSAQHFLISKLSLKVGERRKSALLSVYDISGMAHRASKVLEVMQSKSFRTLLELKRRESASAMVQTRLLHIYPRATLEIALSIGGILVIILTCLFDNNSNLLSNLVLFIFAGLRIIPILSHLQSLTTSIISESAFIKSEMNLFEHLNQIERESSTQVLDSETPFIELVNVSYQYPGEDVPALDKINLKFEKAKIYSIVGDTGSGKSTLFDICLRVIQPGSGYVNSAACSIGYVPQNYELFSGSIFENIALEWDKSFIDSNRLRELELQLNAFPEILEVFKSSNPPSELSGGQKQIVNILRALYRKPKILLLDEATSALDNNTESQISNLLQIDKKERITIVIAHRISTIQASDSVIFLDKGTVTYQGTFDQMRRNVPSFEQYIELGNVN
jgi:ABC-type multidrug transport system fused ATPase/permease subunit